MKYIPTIGLEVHVQLNTKTKLFTSAPTSFGANPNSNTSPLCLALPGSLPVLNKEVVQKAISAALAIEAKINKKSHFDRKSYFYPDLPKGYQISQYYTPYCEHGKLTIDLDNNHTKTIGITRIHIEEDAGKLIHSEDSKIQESYVDLNRAGTPLLEIVSEPEIDNSHEAYLYLSTLRNIMLYMNVSDCNMEEGSLRCDANVSVRPEGTTKLGTRVEIKNLNTFKGVKAAIDYEIERQIESIEAGQKIIQETRLWNATLSKTFSMRSKEEAKDYRYFPDPDLTPLIITEEEIDHLRKQLPELPKAKQERFLKDYQLPIYDINVLTTSKDSADYFESVVNLNVAPKKASNWIMTEMLALLGEKRCILKDLATAENIADLLKAVESGSISGKIAKEVFAEMVETKSLAKDIISKKGLSQINDESLIQKIVDEVISENQESVTSFKNGKDKALGFLVGQVMQKSKGKANPPLANKLLLEAINK